MRYDNEIKLQQAFNTVIKEFENYKNNLLDKSMLIVYRDRNTKQLDYIIINFIGNNYYHLTGLAYKEDNGDAAKDSYLGSRFYNDLKDKKLSVSNLKIKYVAKGHNLESLTYNSELKSLFSLDEYKEK